MNKKMYAAAGSFVIAAVLALAGLNKYELSIGDSFTTEINIYPAAFFALLGLVLIFLSFKSKAVDHT